ncbi:MAG: DUF3488 domain-containing protein, partial [Pirellulaceae bacterium]|nr:DUF3488 domain-containing protein [Pirellulaceae bacterium]
MVRDEVVRVRRLLTLMLVLLAFLTATLVAVGSQSIFLPLLVLVVGVSSLLFVDWFEWFSLHHVLAYFGMIFGTIIALGDYFFQAGADTSKQLCSIASLLIYPELVIMLQRKSLRLFEQLAIFLLLEIIVAALVNDNVLFGVLLAPIVLLWVASLLLFTRYAALIQLAPDLDKPTPRVIELVADAWKKARQRHQIVPARMLEVHQPVDARSGVAGLSTVLGQAAPIGVVSLVFAGLYFYLLPRAAIDMESLAMAPRTGLSETMTLGSMNKLLQDKTLVMHLSLRDPQTDEPYRLSEPPYIRGTVVSRYYRTSANTTSFESSDQAHNASDLFEVLTSSRYPPDTVGGDPVVANFEILLPDGSMLPCLAPMTNYERQRNFLKVMPFEWRMIDNRTDHFPHRSKASYTLLTYAFRQGQEWPVLPDSRRVTNRPARNTQAELLGLLSRVRMERGYYLSRWIDDLLVKVHERSPNANSPIKIARAAEEYFSQSGEFTYSLAPRTANQSDMDPIEDFVVNQKRGHCQYFAAALTMTLRHLGIPTRIVMGYHPLEYNEIGDYFTVRRRDAHAWVEAYFTAQQLREVGLYTPDLGDHGGWLRLDPTPAGMGSNAGNELRPQADQSMDFVNRVWNEYVLNGRQRAEDNSLYGPLQESTRQTYQKMLDLAKEIIKRAQESRLVGGAINRENWFSWPVAVLIMVVGGSLVLLWRLIGWIPRWAPQLARKLGLVHRPEDIHQQFFKHCLRLLRRAGFSRSSSQTALEYTGSAAEDLASSGRWTDAPQQLEFMTEAYYQ